MHQARNHRERLVSHVHELERLAAIKRRAAEDFKEAMARAKGEGFDPTTLKVVLKLRQMTSTQRAERKALEAIYLAALGMLEGEPLPEAARRRLDPETPAPQEPTETNPDAVSEADAVIEPSAPQPALPLKTVEDARAEGAEAAARGHRIYDNPYPAGDPCRAAWDEGWCAQSKSHGMETPAAYRRREAKPEKPGKPDADADAPQDGGAA